MAEREEKLKNLTARIKANNHAREEPGKVPTCLTAAARSWIGFWACLVRKVKMATATVKPGRRSGVRRGGFSRPMERPQPGSESFPHSPSRAFTPFPAQLN